MVNIQTNKSGEFSVVIETLNWTEICSDRFNGNTHQIDLSSFQKGVYLIIIRSKDFVTIKKIIKLPVHSIASHCREFGNRVAPVHDVFFVLTSIYSRTRHVRSKAYLNRQSNH